jgi:hypothetical protein
MTGRHPRRLTRRCCACMRCRYGTCSQHGVGMKGTLYLPELQVSETSRCPHRPERAASGGPRQDRSPSQQRLTDYVEALHAKCREAADRNEFLQKRIRLVSKERDLLKMKTNMLRRDYVAALTKWIFPPYEGEAWISELLDEAVIDDSSSLFRPDKEDEPPSSPDDKHREVFENQPIL